MSHYWTLLMEQMGLRVCGACELGIHKNCVIKFIGGDYCDCKTCNQALRQRGE